MPARPQNISPSLSHLLARNSFFNFVGQGVLILLALVAIPFIVPGLGEERFGLLSLLWVFIGYFSLLDFGIGRALTKSISASLARKEKGKIDRVVWSAVWAGTVVGSVIGVLMLFVAPWFSAAMLGPGEELHSVATEAFRIASAGVPLVILFGIFRGVLSSLQRFFLINMLQLLIGIGQWGGTLILVLTGYGVREIFLLTVCVRGLAVVVILVFLPRYLPSIYDRIRPPERAALRELFSFGGWITVSQIVGQVLVYLDRFLIGFLLSLSAVSYYVVPQEALLKVLIIPYSLTNTLFPAMTERNVAGDRGQFDRLYRRSFRYLLALLLPVVAVVIVFSSDLLGLWMGPEYAAQSSTVFQVLAMGILFTSLAQLPSTALHAFNRPDITAKFHLIELPVSFIMTVLLINSMGILGGALAWTLRAALDTGLLFWAVRTKTAAGEEFRTGSPLLNKNLVLTLLSAGVVILLSLFVTADPYLRVGLSGVCLLAYIFIVWGYWFDETDRDFLLSLRSKIFSV